MAVALTIPGRVQGGQALLLGRAARGHGGCSTMQLVRGPRNAAPKPRRTKPCSARCCRGLYPGVFALPSVHRGRADHDAAFPGDHAGSHGADGVGIAGQVEIEHVLPLRVRNGLDRRAVNIDTGEVLQGDEFGWVFRCVDRVVEGFFDLMRCPDRTRSPCKWSDRRGKWIALGLGRLCTGCLLFSGEQGRLRWVRTARQGAAPLLD